VDDVADPQASNSLYLVVSDGPHFLIFLVQDCLGSLSILLGWC